MGAPVTAHLKWFEIFRALAGESESAYVRTHSAEAAVMRYVRRCGGEGDDFYAVEAPSPRGRV